MNILLKSSEAFNISLSDKRIKMTSDVSINFIQYLRQYLEIKKESLKNLKLFRNKNLDRFCVPQNASTVYQILSVETQIYPLIKLFNLILNQEIIGMECFTEGLEKILNETEKKFQELVSFHEKVANDYKEIEHDLVSVYKIIHKTKKDYYDSVNKAEDNLIKYYNFKKSNELEPYDIQNEILGIANNQSNYLTKNDNKIKPSILKEKENHLSNIIDCIINMKKFEKEYINSYKKIGKREDNYISTSKADIETSLDINKNMIVIFKDSLCTICAFFKGGLRNLYSLLEEFIKDYSTKKIGEKFMEDIKLHYQTKQFDKIKLEPYNVKVLNKFLNGIKEYTCPNEDWYCNNKIIDINTSKPIGKKLVQNKDLNFEEIHDIIEVLYKNLSLKPNYNFEIENNKINLNKLIDKLLSSEKISEQENLKIYEYLKDNQVIQFFLMKLNDNRRNGKFHSNLN